MDLALAPAACCRFAKYVDWQRSTQRNHRWNQNPSNRLGEEDIVLEEGADEVGGGCRGAARRGGGIIVGIDRGVRGDARADRFDGRNEEGTHFSEARTQGRR